MSTQTTDFDYFAERTPEWHQQAAEMDAALQVQPAIQPPADHHMPRAYIVTRRMKRNRWMAFGYHPTLGTTTTGLIAEARPHRTPKRAWTFRPHDPERIRG